MVNKRNKKSPWSNVHLRYILITMVVSCVIYYSPLIAGAALQAGIGYRTLFLGMSAW